MIRPWFRALARRFLSGRPLQTTARPVGRAGVRPRLEALEDRTVTATLALEPPGPLALPPAGVGISFGQPEPAVIPAFPIVEEPDATGPGRPAFEVPPEEAPDLPSPVPADPLPAEPPPSSSTDPPSDTPTIAPPDAEPEAGDGAAITPTVIPTTPPAATPVGDGLRGDLAVPAGPAAISTGDQTFTNPPASPAPVTAGPPPAPPGTVFTFEPDRAENADRPAPPGGNADPDPGLVHAAGAASRRVPQSPPAAPAAAPGAPAAPPANGRPAAVVPPAGPTRTPDATADPPGARDLAGPEPQRVVRRSGQAPAVPPAVRAEAPAATADLPDGALLRRYVADREQGAFAALVRRHERSVLGVSHRVLGDWHAAQDVVQATFLVLARKAGMLDGDGPLAGWLYKVAYHLALRLRAVTARRRRREKEAADARPPEAPVPEPAGVEQREMGEALSEELLRLPEKYRVPLVLCYLDGHTHEEAARAIGMPRGSMAKRVRQGLERLRQRLHARGLAP